MKGGYTVNRFFASSLKQKLTSKIATDYKDRMALSLLSWSIISGYQYSYILNVTRIFALSQLPSIFAVFHASLQYPMYLCSVPCIFAASHVSLQPPMYLCSVPCIFVILFPIFTFLVGAKQLSRCPISLEQKVVSLTQAVSNASCVWRRTLPKLQLSSAGLGTLLTGSYAFTVRGRS